MVMVAMGFSHKMEWLYYIEAETKMAAISQTLFSMQFLNENLDWNCTEMCSFRSN